MSAYGALAASYDELTRDVPYGEIADFLESVLHCLGRRLEGNVLDLACGTGSLSLLLSARGCRVISADASEEMLTVAADKALALAAERRPFFIRQPMQELELTEPVDLAVCCLDSLNYLTDPADCQEALRRVYANLKPGGAFLFDINSPEKLRALDGQIFLDETEDTYCVWRAELEDEICWYGMDLFQREDQLWRRSFEEHAERLYEPERLETWLQEAGFSLVRRFGDRRLDAPGAGEERIYFVAVKEPVV